MTTMHAPDRGPWTLEEVATGTAEISPEGAWSPSLVGRVRTGKVLDPSGKRLATLAAFFHVPVTYFLGTEDEVAAIDAEIEFVQAMRNPAVRDVALRATELTPSGLRVVTDMIKELSANAPAKPRRRSTPSGPAGRRTPSTGDSEDSASPDDRGA